MRLNATIHAEFGVSERSIEAVEVGLLATFSKTGLRLGVDAVRLSQNDMFPALANGQVSDAVVAGHPLWEGGGPNVWLTARDLTHYDQSTSFIYGVASKKDGHMAVSSARLDISNKDEPIQLMTVVAHEAGHMAGLVDETSDRHDARYGFAGHCRNDCTMQSSNGIDDIERAVERLMSSPSTAAFCLDCLGDLSKFGRSMSSGQ